MINTRPVQSFNEHVSELIAGVNKVNNVKSSSISLVQVCEDDLPGACGIWRHNTEHKNWAASLLKCPRIGLLPAQAKVCDTVSCTHP